MDTDFSSSISLLDFLSPETGIFIIQENLPLHLDSAQSSIFVIMGRAKGWAGRPQNDF